MKDAKVIGVLGARPQFIKAAAISRALADRKALEQVIVHTGQHYDPEMSGNFFRELELAEPRYHLDVHGGGHGAMTGRMLESLEAILQVERPDAILVYGDTKFDTGGCRGGRKTPHPGRTY